MSKIKLPARKTSKEINVGHALEKRASCRNFERKSITMQELANILWAGQGVISKSFNMRRTAPSAGATFPLEILVAVRKKGVDGLEEGIYQYIPEEHSLHKLADKDITGDLVEACFNQDFIQNAGVNLMIACDYNRTKDRYAERGERYVWMEAGSATQNVALEAVELKLGTVVIGAFEDNKVSGLYGLDKWHPVAVMPIGRPKDRNIYV
jgi:SagB-type dehydrogenase family enzyme